MVEEQFHGTVEIRSPVLNVSEAADRKASGFLGLNGTFT